MLRTLLALCLLISLSSASVFDELERKLSSTKTIKVSFIQRVKYTWYPKADVSKGYFYASRDGRFKIEYTYPDRVVIFSRGKELIIYNKDLKEALIDSIDNNRSAVIEALLFFSRPLSEVFKQVGQIDRGLKKTLVLRPIKEEEDIKEIYLELSQDLEIQRLRIYDKEDTETVIEFIEVIRNFTPSEELFRETIPLEVKIRRVS
jgi:outer membrane lipoprotein carrier protein